MILRNRLYYALKPLLPERLRLRLRRAHVRGVLQRCTGVWPILESAGRKPDGWPGWPEGKQFAFVLTHDVESQVGVDGVRALAELEMSLGFRSSFNFVPEGTYRVPRELREWLVENGFEVGVHDHRHDGRLYATRDQFRTSARRINHYLREWGAVGFRSGFMFHKLDWLHDLEIGYDASTFDTDPFEPQPDGVGTIFPFWVRRGQDRLCSAGGQDGGNDGVGFRTGPAGRESGYLELPYTLVQDSTLFQHLGERTIDIWARKLAWIASKGGMALLNTHPDYMALGPGQPGDRYPYPMAQYRDLLLRVRDVYAGAAWHVLPRELVRFAAPHAASRTGVRRRVAMLTHSFYESDNRVMRYAEALAARGDQVEVLALRDGSGTPRVETLEGVELTRVQRRLSDPQAGRFRQLLSVAGFGLLASTVLSWRHLRRRYDFIHVHNIPDFLVFAAWLPKLGGTPVILDVHDLVPEFYAAKFAGAKETRTVRALRRIERWSGAFADHVIVSNHLWRGRLVQRSVPEAKCSVFVNNVDPGVFWRHPRTRRDDRFVLLFPGGLQWHQGLDIAVRAMARIADQLPRVELHIYGNGPEKQALARLVSELRLEQRVHLLDPVSLRQVPQLMADADLGVVPKRADSFGDEAYSTKIMEFMSQGVPVVISRTRIDSYYFSASVVRFFESGDPESLAQAIVELASDPERHAELSRNGLEYADAHSWAVHQGRYLGLVDALIERQPKVVPVV